MATFPACWMEMTAVPTKRRRQTRLMQVCLALTCATSVAVTTVAPALARTIVWARSGDALTLDPHAMNEGPTLTLLRQIYEPLVALNRAGKLEPALASAWSMTADPSVWRFVLRQDIRFHDGSPLTIDDVRFSIERAAAETSDMRALVANITEIADQADGTFTIRTAQPDPLLAMRLAHIFIVSKRWATQNDLALPRRLTPEDPALPAAPNAAQSREVGAVNIANGTGPFQLDKRKPGAETELRRHEGWWGWPSSPAPIARIVYRVIGDDKERVDALIAGKVDFVQDVPVSAQATLAAQPALRVNVGPDNRVIFLGLNLQATLVQLAPAKQPAGPSSAVANAALNPQTQTPRQPFQDPRVRRAFDLAIDRAEIQRVVMDGQSLPSGIIAPPQINGYPRELDRVTVPDLAKARALLATAGYPQGFDITLNCPNDRYLNDVAICQAVARQLGRIGVRVSVVAQSKTKHFPLLRTGRAPFYLLGWGVPTFDSAYIFQHLFHTRTTTNGSWNGTGFTDATVDAAIRSLQQETDRAERARRVAMLWERLKASNIYLPIHIQTLRYAMSQDLDIPVDATNKPRLAFARVIINAGETDGDSATASVR